LDQRKLREMSRSRHGRKQLLQAAPRSAAIKGLTSESDRDVCTS